MELKELQERANQIYAELEYNLEDELIKLVKELVDIEVESYRIELRKRMLNK